MQDECAGHMLELGQREAAALRDSAARGDFATAEAAASLYTEAVCALVKGLPPAEAAARIGEACELMEWARRNLCAARSRVEEHVRRLECLGRYHARLLGAEHLFHIDG